MFYPVPSTDSPSGRPASTYAVVVLTPSESKRLLARAVVALPEVLWARERGRVIVARGSTTAFVAEELLGVNVSKGAYCAGLIARGELRVNPEHLMLPPFVLVDGRVGAESYSEALSNFAADDVLIKSANAVDPQGNAGVLMASDVGGTIGAALPIVVPRGAHLIMPVGLEKLVTSVTEASHKLGIGRCKFATGWRVALMPVVNALVVTEVQALNILAGVGATHVASGGIGGSEGSVVLALEGGDEQLERAFRLVQSVKGEPPVREPEEPA